MSDTGDETSETVRHILHEASMDPAPADIILVHGALDRGMAFRKVAQHLHRYNVTMYDRRGYGASVTMAPTTDMDVHIADLLGLMTDRPAVVIGHSFGGLISLLAATKHPDRFAALGIYEAPMPGTKLGDGGGPTPPEDPDDLVRWFYKRQGDDAFDEMPERAQSALLAEGPGLAADLSAVASLTEPLDATAIAVPTVVAYGAESNDRHVTRSQALVEQLPNAQVFVAEGAKHPCHRTHPDQFVAFIKATVDLME